MSEKRDAFGRSAYRILVILLLTGIVLQLSQIIGQLQFIIDKALYG